MLIAIATLAGIACSSNTPSIDGNTLQGRFLDAAVQGLRYRTNSQSGTTSEDGTFNYLAGETVVFSVGDVDLPEVLAQATVTPLDVFDTSDLFDLGAINLARLLLTLDEDGNADNGIAINDTAHAAATGLSADFQSRRFDSQVINLVANSGSSQTTLVSLLEANAHLIESLDSNGELNSGCTSEHRSVGQTAVFNGLFHEVAGQLTVIDDCTLEITGFTYDGLGPDVYFYTGSSAEYNDGNNFIIGPRLNGNRWSEQRIRLHIPAGQTLDDFDRISVWCIDFDINFGDALFGS